jgi:transposase
VPSWENRDLRQLLWHRHRMVQARTRIMNQLQAVALNEGLRCKKRLWRERGRQQLESFRLAPWASRRRRDLLELLDRLNPTIAELSQTVEQEVEKCPEAQRLRTHPGVGALTALAFVLIIGKAERFQCGKQVASYLGLVPLEESSGNRRRLGHITKQFTRQIAPVLNACAECDASKKKHHLADHEYRRREDMVEWHGWHAFRRGLATNLNDIGALDLTIQRILRHSDVTTTRKSYIKPREHQMTAVMAQFEGELQRRKTEHSEAETHNAERVN